jgi:hypothetical protein
MALHYMFLGTQGVDQRMGGDLVHGSHSRIMSYAIPAMMFLEKGPERWREGGFEDLHPQ